MKPDVLITSPYSVDFPYWRYLMREIKPKVGKIINMFYNDNRNDDYHEWIEKVSPYIHHHDVGQIPSGWDWRNYCINEGLKYSGSEWILFLEQDFVTDNGFWDEVFKVSSGNVIGFKQQERIHPAFLLTKREMIDKTSSDFAAHTEQSLDHFGVFTRELMQQKDAAFVDISDFYDWYHYNGVTSNFMLLAEQKLPNYKPQEFKEFIHRNIEADIPQHPKFIKLCEKFI